MVNFGNKFLNVLADREVSFRTHKWYLNEKYLFIDCSHGKIKREELVQLVAHGIFNNFNGMFV